MPELTQQLEFRNKVYIGIFWTSLAVILLWYLTLSLGFAKGLLWFELLPVLMGVSFAGASWKKYAYVIH